MVVYCELGLDCLLGAAARRAVAAASTASSAAGARAPPLDAERFGRAGMPVRCCAQAGALVPLVPLHLRNSQSHE